MDALRSCYRTTMRFPGVGLVEVVWYWTDKPPLNKTHVYGSHNHSREQGWDDADTGEPGEVWGAERTWYSGSPLIDTCCSGPQGSDTAWEGESDASSPLYMVPTCEQIAMLAKWRRRRRWKGNAYSGPTVAAAFDLEHRLLVDTRTDAVYSATWRQERSLSAVAREGTAYQTAWDQERQLSSAARHGVYYTPSWDQERSLVTTEIARGNYSPSWGSESLWTATVSETRSDAAAFYQEREWDAIIEEQENVLSFQCGAQVAAGSTQGTATAIANDTVSATSTGAGQGLILPDGCYRIYIRNANAAGGNAILVYPPSGATISTGLANIPVSMVAQTSTLFTRITSTHWSIITGSA